MGYQKFKRPIDVRTKAAPDIKFDTMLSTGDVANVSLTATSSVAGATVSASKSITASSSMVTATLTASAGITASSSMAAATVSATASITASSSMVTSTFTASSTATVNTLVCSSSASFVSLAATSSAVLTTFTASGTGTVNTLVASSSATINTLTVTSSAKANTFTATSGIQGVTYKRSGITTSTAASTALAARGVVELGTSSTTAAANFIISVPAAAGEELTLVVKPNGSTFGVTVNASTATLVNFGAVTATTDQIRLVMPGTLGTAAQLISLSTTRWLVVNHNGCSFTTEAA